MRELTADTITDEQIRALRAETHDRYQRGEEFPGPDKRASARELLQLQSAALNPTGGAIGPDGRRITQEESRARCAEIMNERALARYIRAICARELGQDPDYDWFWADAREGEPTDARLVRLFLAERDSQRSSGLDPTDEDVVLVLCHG